MKKEIIIKESDGRLNIETTGFSRLELVGIYESLRVRNVVILNKEYCKKTPIE